MSLTRLPQGFLVRPPTLDDEEAIVTLLTMDANTVEYLGYSIRNLLLHHALVDVVTKGIPLVQAKAQYETEMLRYGFEAVADSLSKPFAPSASRRKHAD